MCVVCACKVYNVRVFLYVPSSDLCAHTHTSRGSDSNAQLASCDSKNGNS